MTTDVLLANWTDQGLKSIVERRKRTDAVSNSARFEMEGVWPWDL